MTSVHRNYTLKIQLLLIHHRHGTNTYVRVSREQIRFELYKYVKDWWSSWFLHERTIPKDKEEAITAYFDRAEDSEQYEIEEETVELSYSDLVAKEPA